MVVTRRHAPAARRGAHVLHPGDVVLALRGETLETLLGSCVAIILTDPRRTLAAMCHIVHSGSPAAGAARGNTAHAGPALEAMFTLLRGKGITASLCDAYVYGGGNMFPGLVKPSHVGDRNAAWAEDTLAAMGVRVLGVDLGGTTYRRIAWTVGPGEPSVQGVQMAAAV